jgi:DNA repair photolyase
MSAAATQLVGIAKLASEGHLLTQKQRVQYRTLPTRRWINRCDSSRVPFDWTLNPYRGCEFGCKYCYARYTHEFMELWDPMAFETEIYAKEWNQAAFRAELRSVRHGQTLAIGTATDPYQPAERRYCLTRRALEALTTVSGRRIYLTTKSDLAARDIDLWQTIAKNNVVGISITVTTVDISLARILEPYAPRPDLRLEAAKEFAAAGLKVGIIASPVMPMINDSREGLEAIAFAAHQAGATTFWANVLFLKPCSQRVFFPFLEDQFPHLAARYRASYGNEAFLHGTYPDRIRDMVRQIRQKFGLVSRDEGEMPTEPPTPQLTLF